jgi:far upstream element-binding protein
VSYVSCPSLSNTHNIAAQRPVSNPQQGQAPQANVPMPGYQFPPGMPAGMPGFPLPQPISSGSLDLSAIKPVNTGSVSINDALAKARSFAAEKGIQYDPNRSISGMLHPNYFPEFLLLTLLASGRGGNSYRHSRSRSRSPQHRDSYSNPYRDERRDDSRRGGGYGRDRSRSPTRGTRFSPQNGRSSYGRERSPPRRENDDSEVINIESNLVGLVIGRQGENLRRIEQDTGARIQFITPADHPGPQRQCRISGNPRARADAKREIFRTIEDNNNVSAPRDQNRGASNTRQQAKSPSLPALREGENAMQIMVPDRTVGLIIGRGGETIRDLQERSGCHINIVGVNKSVNGLRPVNLIGTAEASQKAKDLIMEIVESDTRGPAAQNDAPQNGGQPRSNDYQQNSNRDQGKINETIYVPSEAVGMIIGKGGETIKEMQSTTQCKINVTQASGADVEREIGLVGSAQAIDQAKRAIMEKVDMVVSIPTEISYEILTYSSVKRVTNVVAAAVADRMTMVIATHNSSKAKAHMVGNPTANNNMPNLHKQPHQPLIQTLLLTPMLHMAAMQTTWPCGIRLCKTPQNKRASKHVAHEHQLIFAISRNLDFTFLICTKYDNPHDMDTFNI